MDQKVAKALKLNEQRSELLEHMANEYGSQWAEQYGPGTFGCHELLDRAALVVDIVERQVLSHPSCVQNEQWFILAYRASEALSELYQQVGNAHLGTNGDPT